MFCQECGFNNVDSKEGVFCESCGAKLETTTKKQSVSAFEESGNSEIGLNLLRKVKEVDISKVKQLNKKAKALIVGVVALAVAVVALMLIGSNLSNPERIVKAYFESYASANYEKAYSFLSLPESKFLNKESYSKSMMQENVSAMDIASFEIINPNKGPNVDNASQISMIYQINYILRGESTKRRFTVNLVQQDKRRFLFYKDYKVGLDNLVVRDFEIYAPDDINLLFDGVLLPSRENMTDSNDGLKAYVVDAAFKGKHSITATSELFKDISQEVSFDGRDSIVLNTFEVKDDIRTFLSQNTYNIFTSIVQAAIKKSELMSIDNISNILTSNPENLRKIQEQYQSLFSRVSNDDGTGLKSVTFNGFKDKTNSYSLNKEGQYVCDIEYKYTFTKITKDWGTETLTEQTSASEQVGTTRFCFAYEDGNWKIVSWDRFNLYY